MSLSPLSALTGLTLLDMAEEVLDARAETRRVPPDVSALSTLTALRVLRCSFFDEAGFAAGDPLPVQLHFLRTATALHELQLGFYVSFWSLPDASSYAVRAAVSALTTLKNVNIEVHTPFEDRLRERYVPLAPSIEGLRYHAEVPVEEVPPLQAFEQASCCLTALSKLQSLHLTGMGRGGFTPDCLGYGLCLAGLRSTQLKRLFLHVDTASAVLTEQIAHFCDLQELMVLCKSASLGFLDPLFKLKCLRHLHLSLDGKAVWERGGAISSIKADAERLESAIIESCRVVGRSAFVFIDIREEDDDAV